MTFFTETLRFFFNTVHSEDEFIDFANNFSHYEAMYTILHNCQNPLLSAHLYRIEVLVRTGMCLNKHYLIQTANNILYEHKYELFTTIRNYITETLLPEDHNSPKPLQSFTYYHPDEQVWKSRLGRPIYLDQINTTPPARGLVHCTEKLARVKCTFCKERGHKFRECPNRLCKYYNKKPAGHFPNRCPERPPPSPINSWEIIQPPETRRQILPLPSTLTNRTFPPPPSLLSQERQGNESRETEKSLSFLELPELPDLWLEKGLETGSGKWVE